MALPPEHGFPPLQDRRRPCWAAPSGPAQVEQDCALGYILSNALSVLGPLSSAREAKGKVGISWEGCLGDQKRVAVRLMLKRLRCEIIIDQDLLKARTMELILC